MFIAANCIILLVGSDPNLITIMSTITRTTRGGAGRSLLPKHATAQTAEIIGSLRDDYGVKQTMLVHMSGYSPRSILSWSKGTKATKPAKTKLVEIKRLFDALADLVQDRKEVTAWFNEPNEAFDGSTPLQVLERGESDRLWRMIYLLESGQPG